MFSFIEFKPSYSNIGYAPFIKLDLNVPGVPESPDQYCNLAQVNPLFPVFQYFVNNKFCFSLLVIKFSYKGNPSLKIFE
jgi:hypothetical protein